MPALATTPALLYFHENQFAYPANGNAAQRLEPQMVSLYAALSAQRLAFNSRYNRDTFIAGVADLMRRLPDAVPAAVPEALQQRAAILPVPLPEDVFRPAPRPDSDRLTVLWNHRWEYDKGPRQLLAAVRQLLAAALPITLHVVGQQFRRRPEEFDALRRLLAGGGSVRAGHWGYLQDTQRYRQLLQESDVVLSTALHDFQGLAVQEAVAAGCVPLVPDRLCYPEYFAAPYCYLSAPDEVETEAAALVQRLAQWRNNGLPAVPDLNALNCNRLLPDYRRLLSDTSAGQGESGAMMRRDRQLQ